MQNYLFDSVGFKPRLNEIKPPADASDFLMEIRRGKFDYLRKNN
jgi:hypothetical protein